MKLYIENLPPAISKRHVETALLPHGWFDAIRMLRHPATGEPVALVETCLPEEGERLARRLEGGEILGRRIRVRSVADVPPQVSPAARGGTVREASSGQRS